MGGITLSDKQRDWLQHVEACTAAGGSMKVYAERHGLNLASLYFWKGQLRKLGVLGAPPDDGIALEPVHVRAVQQDASVRIALANGIAIEAPGEIDADALGRLIKAAQQAS